MTTYNTGNPIGSTDARDLYDNAQAFDNFANGSAASYSDRLGVSRRSLAGIDAAADNVLNSIGYSVPVAYASGISLTLTSQTVDYNGVIYAPKSSALPFTTSSWGTDSGKFRAVQVTDAALITYNPAGTDTAPTNVQEELDRAVVNVFRFMTPEQIADVRAGTASISVKAAVEAAAASLPSHGGVLRLPAGRYHSPSGFLFSRSNITIVGDGMPRVADDLNSLVGGTILNGTVLIDGDNISVENLGADHGITYSNTHKAGAGGDGLVIHKVGLNATRKNINVRNVVGLTRIGDYNDAQAAFHAVLLEGLRGGSADNVVGVGGWFGVVLKVADFNVGKVIGRENDAASVYLKSNSYATVDRVNIESVIASNYIARGFVGLLVQSSDAELQAVTVGNVSVMGGANAVRVEGEVSQPCVSVAIGNIATRGGSTGFSVRGPVYGLTVGTVSVWQPSDTGFLTAGNTSGTHPIDVTIDTLRVVPSATSTKAVDIGNQGTKVVFNSVNAAGAGGSIESGSIINVQPTTEIGQYFGTLNANGSLPALVNGWAASYAQPTGVVAKSGWTRGYGRLSSAAATSDTFMTIPSGMRPNNLEFFTSMTAHDGSTGKVVPVNVQVSANGNVSIYPNRASYTNISWWNLTDLMFPTRIPAEGAI